MTDDLLVRAQRQAEQSAPPVRAAARMRIARVQSATDPGQARVIFEMALDEIRSLPSRERQILFEQAQRIAAAFAPDLLREIPAVRLFQYRWTMLPPEEALVVVREIVNTALDRPDLGTSARYPEVHITSSREHVLFEVLHILRRLDPDLAESLIASHSQLAAAAQRYPNGTETMHRELELHAEERRKEMAASGENCGETFMMAGAGDPRDFARQMALHRSSQQGDFGPSIDHALELYREDTDPNSPNQNPKAFWPSACSFRATLYGVGKRLGPTAATLLEDIADDDLRLFAQIELAAALASLPAMRETSMKRRPPPM